MDRRKPELTHTHTDLHANTHDGIHTHVRQLAPIKLYCNPSSQSNSFDDFRHHLREGFTCNFSSADDCHGLAAKNWLFILSYCLSNLFQFFLIQQTEGAVFTVVVQSLVTPMASLFWTFFKLNSSTLDLVWSPDFTETTVFTLGGLAIIVPAVILYNVFGRMDAKADDKTDIQ